MSWKQRTSTPRLANDSQRTAAGIGMRFHSAGVPSAFGARPVRRPALSPLASVSASPRPGAESVVQCGRPRQECTNTAPAIGRTPTTGAGDAESGLPLLRCPSAPPPHPRGQCRLSLCVSLDRIASSMPLQHLPSDADHASGSRLRPGGSLAMRRLAASRAATAEAIDPVLHPDSLSSRPAIPPRLGAQPAPLFVAPPRRCALEADRTERRHASCCRSTRFP